MEEFLVNLYQNNINYVVNDFNNDEIEEVKKAYLSYLKENYFDVLDNKYNKNDIIKVFSDLEKNKWSSKSKKEKQVLLLEDAALDRLGHISDIGLKYALERLDILSKNLPFEPKISEEEANQYIEEMKQEKERVREYNKSIAEKYLSEGIIDFIYATGKSDNMSFRLSR